MRHIGSVLVGCFLSISVTTPSLANSPAGPSDATVQVRTNGGMNSILVNIQNKRRLGTLSIEVKDLTGRTLYREEGKSPTEELVRSLDKRGLPKGEHVLVVTTRDFSIAQAFTIE